MKFTVFDRNVGLEFSFGKGLLCTQYADEKTGNFPAIYGNAHFSFRSRVHYLMPVLVDYNVGHRNKCNPAAAPDYNFMNVSSVYHCHTL